VPKDCIGDGTPELVQAACGTFERILLAGDLTNLSQLAETLAEVEARQHAGSTRCSASNVSRLL
jgi:hypothetical protein